MTTSVLFVCLGNICRSPTAEGVMRMFAEQSDLDLIIDSAGTSDWHVGEPPYAPMRQAASARGYNLSVQRARQFTAADFERFDLILAMDKSNLSNIEALRPDGSTTQARLLLDFAPDQPLREVPDPYYTYDFDQAIDLAEQAVSGLIESLRS